jgi:hypothetical protein
MKLIVAGDEGEFHLRPRIFPPPYHLAQCDEGRALEEHLLRASSGFAMELVVLTLDHVADEAEESLSRAASARSRSAPSAR